VHSLIAKFLHLTITSLLSISQGGYLDCLPITLSLSSARFRTAFRRIGRVREAAFTFWEQTISLAQQGSIPMEYLLLLLLTTEIIASLLDPSHLVQKHYQSAETVVLILPILPLLLRLPLLLTIPALNFPIRGRTVTSHLVQRVPSMGQGCWRVLRPCGAKSSRVVLVGSINEGYS
jgi:hypothetical protein